MMKANNQLGFININEDSIDKIIKDDEVIFERGFLREKTSTTLPTTFDGVGKDLKDYKVYGNTKQQILPDGYTQVDYIESSGKQYIDTGFIPNFNTEVELEFLHQQPNSSGFIYGSRIANNNNCHTFILFSGAKDYYPQFSNNASVVHLSDTYPELALANTKYKVKNGKNGFYVNNIQIKNYDGQTSLNSIYPLYIFGLNEAGNLETRTARARIYYFKIYDNDILVRDFIPCYRNLDNEVGLYDLVNKVFYTNQGTGVFTYGSVAPTPDTLIEMVSCGDRTNNLIPTNPDDWEQGGIEARTGSQIESTVRLRNKDYCEIENDKDYYVSLESLNYSYVNIILYDNNKSYLGQYYNIDNRINGTNKIKINIPSLSIANVKYMRVVVKKTNSTTIIPEEISTIKPMITLGDTKLDFEPYGYKIPVNVRSDNLFDKNNANLVHLYTDGIILKYSLGASTYFIECKPNTTYTILKSNTGTNNRFCAFTCDDTPTQGMEILNYIGTPTGGNNSTKYTINTPNTAKYLCVFVSVENTTPSASEISNSIQILEGLITPSKYIPYYNETTNIYLDEPLRRIDEYSDYIDFINGKVVRNIKEYVITSDDKLNNGSASQDGYARVGWGKRSEIAVSDFDKSLVICNKFLGVPQNDNTPSITGKRWQCSLSNTDEYKIMFRSGDLNLNNAELISIIKNNTKVCYPLSTPTEETITLPNIPTVHGNNTLNIETEITPSKVYIKYKSNN